MDSGVSFAELGVPEPLVRVLAADGKATAFPIQADTLADSLAGRDLLGRGRTGSGKTLAFAIPLVARLGGERSGAAAMRDFRRMRRRGEDDAAMRLPHPHGLVLAPTRELVNQIDEVIRPLADAYGLKTVTVYGGVKQGRQVSALRDGADIVVACPGRLEDLLRQGLLSLESVRIAVLDEADEMADMGFLPAVTRLLGQIDPHSQHMLFSATLDHGVDGLVKRFLRDARVHAVDSAESHVDEMTHHVFVVTQGNKHELVRQLASGMGKRILFTRTKYQAKKMAAKLVKAGIPAVDLQGNLSQNQRDRHLAAFSDGKVRVLVATDVAARGVDISGVELVVQVEPPADPKSFLHRSGRTARAGHSGDVVTLVLPGQEKEVRQMMRRAGLRIRSVEVTPTSPEVRELVGEHAPLVTGWELPKPQPQKPAGTGRRSRAGRGRVRGGEARGGAGAVRDGADKRGADKRGADNRGGGKRGAVARNGEERRRGRNGAGAGARGGASGGFRRHRKKAAPFRMGTRH
ncbi:ATP-dependent helicase [Bifidobacterium catulorum]|uniref:ATP-dependent helicase n=1 Tax=Bifidobacterium catulorum TaxID=1630173 RepID=A0A2U2MQ74_9BIFI|nr:ATP-dependent helicase [Bifidobacterium catulorum]